MANKNYQEERVVADLQRKHDLEFREKNITQLRHNAKTAKGDVGHRANGKIDFLVNFCGYNHHYVPKFS